MNSLDEQIAALITTSLFLTEEQRRAVQGVLATASQAQKESLLKIFQVENKAIARGFDKYIKKNGKAGVSALNRMFTKGKKSVHVAKEGVQRQDEEAVMETLLDDLDDLPS